jgi:hypothetical protein
VRVIATVLAAVALVYVIGALVLTGAPVMAAAIAHSGPAGIATLAVLAGLKLAGSGLERGAD